MFNWGIGRELYTAPHIWVKAGDVTLEDKNGGKTTRDHFSVTEIAYDGGNITALEIRNDKLKRIVYTFGKTSGQKQDDELTQNIAQQKIGTDKIAAITARANSIGVDLKVILYQYGLKSIGEMTEGQFLDCIQRLNAEERKKK